MARVGPAKDEASRLLPPESLEVNVRRPLGEGASGSVYYGLLEGAPVAVKVVTTAAEVANEQFEREIRRYLEFRHPSIVQCFGVVQGNPTQKPPTQLPQWLANGPNQSASHRRPRPCPFKLVTELCEGGSLHGAFNAVNKLHADDVQPFVLPQTTIAQIASHVVNALLYMHTRHFSYGDMKPLNILLTHRLVARTGMLPRGTVAKLCDFGLSRRLQKESLSEQNAANSNEQSSESRSQSSSGQLQGTFAYLSPEAFSHIPTERPDHSKAADVYAFGIVLYELLTLHRPWPGLDNWGIHRMVVRQGDRPPWPQNVKVDHDWKQLVEQCWAQVPEERPTAAQLADRVHHLAQAVAQSQPPPASAPAPSTASAHSSHRHRRQASRGCDTLTRDLNELMGSQPKSVDTARHVSRQGSAPSVVSIRLSASPGLARRPYNLQSPGATTQVFPIRRPTAEPSADKSACPNIAAFDAMASCAPRPGLSTAAPPPVDVTTAERPNARNVPDLPLGPGPALKLPSHPHRAAADTAQAHQEGEGRPHRANFVGTPISSNDAEGSAQQDRVAESATPSLVAATKHASRTNADHDNAVRGDDAPDLGSSFSTVSESETVEQSAVPRPVRAQVDAQRSDSRSAIATETNDVVSKSTSIERRASVFGRTCLTRTAGVVESAEVAQRNNMQRELSEADIDSEIAELEKLTQSAGTSGGLVARAVQRAELQERLHSSVGLFSSAEMSEAEIDAELANFE